MYVCMSVEGVGQKSSPCTATFNDHGVSNFQRAHTQAHTSRNQHDTKT
jgi:hypothetical protein